MKLLVWTELGNITDSHKDEALQLYIPLSKSNIKCKNEQDYNSVPPFLEWFDLYYIPHELPKLGGTIHIKEAVRH